MCRNIVCWAGRGLLGGGQITSKKETSPGRMKTRGMETERDEKTRGAFEM